MVKPAVKELPMSVVDYLALEEVSPVRHEYIAGHIYALAGATEPHNRIAGNIFGHLWAAARGGTCRVFMSDMKLRIDHGVGQGSESLFYYPDVMVVCDSGDREALYKTRPCLVVEVLSPGTDVIDRREKLFHYKQLSSLRAYVMASQDEPKASYHYRDENGTWWQAEVAGEGTVPFPCLEVTLSLAEIYEGVF
jgi:Uma2 family endonuclease